MASRDQLKSEPPLLLVDDDHASLQVLVATLEGCGYRLLVANSGANALQILDRVQPALILLDVLMPEMDGFEVCRRLKDNPALASIPVIFLSALEHTSDKVRGLQLGAVDFITKPYQPDEVIARVGTQVKLARLKRELVVTNRQLQATNRHILEAMGEGLLAIGPRGVVRYANPAVEQLTGWRKQDIEGLKYQQLGLFADEKPFIRSVGEVLAGGGGHRVRDCHFRHRDCGLIEVECSLSPLEDAAGSGAVLMFKDITARKQAEREVRAAHQELEQSHQALRETQEQLIRAARLETVGGLAAGVAHEVKNPLAIVQFGVDYLHQVINAGPEIAEVLDEIEEAVGRADHIIKGLLDFSRAQEPSMALADLNEVLRDSVALVEHELQLHGIALRLQLAEEPLPVMVDREKIRQVMVNLMMNAVHAIDGSGSIALRSWSGLWGQQSGAWKGALESFVGDDKVSCCAIEDSGPGIDQDKVDKVFDPFFTTKPVGKGTGLGLSVTANIIDLHKAAISVTNCAGRGARAQLVFKQPNGEAT